jgi:uracil-DNA glycosylase
MKKKSIKRSLVLSLLSLLLSITMLVSTTFAWFTDSVIKLISDQKENVVFILWGGNARSKKALIDQTKHCILECPHPSPLSAYQGFFGCKHFSKTNEYLSAHGLQPIDWDLTK